LNYTPLCFGSVSHRQLYNSTALRKCQQFFWKNSKKIKNMYF